MVVLGVGGGSACYSPPICHADTLTGGIPREKGGCYHTIPLLYHSIILLSYHSIQLHCHSISALITVNKELRDDH